jgi:para-nitrobenzyl esterase
MVDERAKTSEITTSLGVVCGTSSGGVARFLGVPYAAAPFNENRFALPRPHAPWTEPWDATGYGPTAPQTEYPGALGRYLTTVIVAGEEILNLNVWVPKRQTEDPLLPVMVWFHGGSLAYGSNALAVYDGTSFARDGVLFVAANYRLGAEGFSVLDGAPTNVGIADQFAALRWIQREIEAFGGDPRRVTVFGQSAGAVTLGTILAHPDAPSLVSGAILMSGPIGARSRKEAGRITRLMAKDLGIEPTKAAFADIGPERLLASQTRVTAGSTPISGGASFQPSIDADLIPRAPESALHNGAAGGIPLVMGTTTEEYRLWFLPSGLVKRIGWLHVLFAKLKFHIPTKTIGLYRRNRPGTSTGDLFGSLATDLLLRIPMNRLADARLTAATPTFVYEFAWRSPVADLGAAHAVEVGFVFDALDTRDSVALAGAEAPQQLADEIHSAWVHFAKTGDPGWPAWSSERPVMTFDAPQSRVVNSPRDNERSSWH